MIQRSKMFIILVVTAATLLTSAFCNYPFISSADPSAASPISTSANGSTYTVNVSGEVIGTDFYLITADFKAELVNSRTGLHLLSEPFGHGRFTVPVVIPRDAVDNDTFRVRVLSLDGLTVYGETNVTLNDTALNFPVEILVLNPPPNYNGVLIIVLLVVFALIIAMYIFFVRWLIGRMILKRAGEIMIDRQTGRKGGEI